MVPVTNPEVSPSMDRLIEDITQNLHDCQQALHSEDTLRGIVAARIQQRSRWSRSGIPSAIPSAGPGRLL